MSKPPLPVSPPPELIEAMCRTYRHDFGLTRAEDEAFGSGMTEREREGLRLTMRQLWEHDIRPYVARLLDAGR